MTTTEELRDSAELADMEERAFASELVRALGLTANATTQIEKDNLLDPYKVKKVSDLRDQVKQWMGLNGEDDLVYEGWKAHVTQASTNYLDETNDRLTPEVIYWAFKQGILKLDSKAWGAAEKRETAETEAIRKSIVKRDGTSRLTITEDK